MPQHGRKVPCSNKKRKIQMKARRDKKHEEIHTQNVFLEDVPEVLCDEVEKINANSSNKRSRYCLKFKKDKKKKSLQHCPIFTISCKDLEATCDTFYLEGMDYPKRPHWDKITSKDELEMSENRFFRLFCEDLEKKFSQENLSRYELNLETWRQLWRVTEISNIILIVVDARFPVSQFPPYLYKHLREIGKNVILILNKCDLISTRLVIAWQDYFTHEFPDLIIVPFFFCDLKATKSNQSPLTLWSYVRLIDACQKFYKGDLAIWREMVQKQNFSEKLKERESGHESSGNTLTIGVIGSTNVGKSSFINTITGKSVVSTSKTPGHTKHFQTLYITANVILCDSPGLIFPSVCSREMQVLIGSYPIAQVSDPVSCLHYLASRVNIPKVLNLQKSSLDCRDDSEWTPFLICEGWARKKNYFLRTKGGRPDVFRAGNELLRFALIGRRSLGFTLRPKGFSEKEDLYKADSRFCELECLRQKVSCCNEGDTSSEEESNNNEEISEDEEPGEIMSQNKFSLLNLE